MFDYSLTDAKGANESYHRVCVPYPEKSVRLCPAFLLRRSQEPSSLAAQQPSIRKRGIGILVNDCPIIE